MCMYEYVYVACRKGVVGAGGECAYLYNMCVCEYLCGICGICVCVVYMCVECVGCFCGMCLVFMCDMYMVCDVYV